LPSEPFQWFWYSPDHPRTPWTRFHVPEVFSILLSFIGSIKVLHHHLLGRELCVVSGIYINQLISIRATIFFLETN
jgi:hypothetical protein